MVSHESSAAFEAAAVALRGVCCDAVSLWVTCHTVLLLFTCCVGRGPVVGVLLRVCDVGFCVSKSVLFFNLFDPGGPGMLNYQRNSSSQNLCTCVCIAV
jgi:hypothetical protein